MFLIMGNAGFISSTVFVVSLALEVRAAQGSVRSSHCSTYGM